MEILWNFSRLLAARPRSTLRIKRSKCIRIRALNEKHRWEKSGSSCAPFSTAPWTDAPHRRTLRTWLVPVSSLSEWSRGSSCWGRQATRGDRSPSRFASIRMRTWRGSVRRLPGFPRWWKRRPDGGSCRSSSSGNTPASTRSGRMSSGAASQTGWTGWWRGQSPPRGEDGCLASGRVYVARRSPLRPLGNSGPPGESRTWAAHPGTASS